MKYSSLIIIIMLTSIFISTSINVKSYPNVYEKVGQECDESGTISYLDVVWLEVYHTVSNGITDRIYFKLHLRGEIPDNPTGLKWLIKLDTELGSRDTSTNTFYADYMIMITSDGTHNYVDILDPDENDIGDGSYVSGGPGSYYWEIYVDASDVDLDDKDVFFIVAETRDVDDNVKDTAPLTTEGENADYWIYYINPPTIPPGGDWTCTINDDTNDLESGSGGSNIHDIVHVRYDYDSNNLYFEIEVNSQGSDIPWCGGSDTAAYLIYIDVDPGEESQPPGDSGHCFADYKLYFRPGYVVWLYYWTGTGWSFVRKEFYPHAPGSTGYEHKITIITPRSDYGYKPGSKSLGNAIRIIAETKKGSTLTDTAGNCEIAPVPELGLLSIIVFCIILFRIMVLKKDES